MARLKASPILVMGSASTSGRGMVRIQRISFEINSYYPFPWLDFPWPSELPKRTWSDLEISKWRLWSKNNHVEFFDKVFKLFQGFLSGIRIEKISINILTID